jgi:hypothetical protein
MRSAAMVIKYVLAAIAATAVAACAAMGLVHQPVEGNQMKQSVTYLHLLRKTPFFTALDRSQLKWVIDHSTEWEVGAGVEISNRLDGTGYLWVLLDGGWQVEQGGKVYPAGHADPAKWYGGAQAALLPSDSRLVANQHSYVMRIARADFEQMLQQRFAFDAHLRQGEAFYADLPR